MTQFNFDYNLEVAAKWAEELYLTSMAWSISGPYFRLRKSHRTLIYGLVTIFILLGLLWNLSSKRFTSRPSKSSFDVFDVHGLFPGQRVLSGDNVLGLSRREVKLVNRVKGRMRLIFYSRIGFAKIRT